MQQQLVQQVKDYIQSRMGKHIIVDLDKGQNMDVKAELWYRSVGASHHRHQRENGFTTLLVRTTLCIAHLQDPGTCISRL